jgi:quercetin 2,3-dioxygenase
MYYFEFETNAARPLFLDDDISNSKHLQEYLVMITLRRSEERGRTQLGWLDARHSFSFNRYWDPEHVHFGPLVVLNHDVVAPGGGFQPHPHDNMEILTIILRGAVEHADSMGNTTVIRAGEAQRMTAGTGVRHSEVNHSKTDALELLQIWFAPETQDLVPSYEQKDFTSDLVPNTLVAVAGRNIPGALHVHQDATTYRGFLEAGRTLAHTPAAERLTYVYVINGRLLVNGEGLASGDAAMITGEARLDFGAEASTDFIVFDMAD